MRPVLHGDVSSAARALMSAPRNARAALCARMLAEAELAHRHVAKTGRLHPVHGNGSLMTVARNRPLMDEPSFDDLEYCNCFEVVIQQLIRFQISQRRN